MARWPEANGEMAAQEVAAALAELAAAQPSSLVHACRRLVERFPADGVAWWLSARALCAADPVEAIWEAATELATDPTERLLREELERAGGDIVVLSARAAGPADVAVHPRAVARLRSARKSGRTVWAVLPRGVVLPDALWRQLVARAGSDLSLMGAADIRAGITDRGREPLADVLSRPTCPAAAELLGWKS
jgi:hypothetical protein